MNYHPGTLLLAALDTIFMGKLSSESALDLATAGGTVSSRCEPAKVERHVNLCLGCIDVKCV